MYTKRDFTIFVGGGFDSGGGAKIMMHIFSDEPTAQCPNVTQFGAKNSRKKMPYLTNNLRKFC